MNTLFYAPGACSLGIHILLEEIGAPYGLEKVNLMEGQQHKPEFTNVNPKSMVPTLRRADGTVLTEYPAIAYWLAATNPSAKLWPSDIDAQTSALEAMDYIVSTLHMQGFARLFRAGNFCPVESGHEAVQARGRELIEKGFALLDSRIAGKEWIAGSYSVADSALFYVEFWAVARMKIALPENLAAHFERMKGRPAVQRMLQQEGLSA